MTEPIPFRLVLFSFIDLGVRGMPSLHVVHALGDR